MTIYCFIIILFSFNVQNLYFTVLNTIDLKLAALFQNTNTAETVQQKNNMQAALTEDRVLATTNIDSAQKKLEQAIAKHNEKIQQQQTAVLDSEKAFNAGK